MKKAFSSLLFALLAIYIVCGHLLFSNTQMEMAGMVGDEAHSTMAQTCFQADGHCLRSTATSSVVAFAKIFEPQEFRFFSILRNHQQWYLAQQETFKPSFELAQSPLRDQRFSTVFRF